MIANTPLPLNYRGIVFLVLFLMMIHGVTPGASFTPLGPTFFPVDVSGDGTTVIGRTQRTSGGDSLHWSAVSGVSLIPKPPGTTLGYSATKVSGDGQIVVGSFRFPDQAFVWMEGDDFSKRLMGMQADESSIATAISNDGQLIAGRIIERDGLRVKGLPFQWMDSSVSLLETLGGADSVVSDSSLDGSVLVGSSQLPGDDLEQRPVMWADGAINELPSAHRRGVAVAVSPDGNNIVGSTLVGFYSAPARWVGGIHQLIPMLPGHSQGFAADVNHDGSIIVGSSDDFQDTVAFIWTPETSTVSISEYLANRGVDINGWQLTSSSSISNDGQVIIGIGTDPFGEPQGWIVNLVADGPEDLNANGVVNVDDLDLLVSSMASMSSEVRFDFSGNGVVDLDDVSFWLSEAATKNGLDSPYEFGDTNLDGEVDETDFTILSDNRFSVSFLWSEGNFNGDGVVDVRDFNIWNANRGASLAFVPEPSALFLFSIAALLFLLSIGDQRPNSHQS